MLLQQFNCAVVIVIIYINYRFCACHICTFVAVSFGDNIIMMNTIACPFICNSYSIFSDTHVHFELPDENKALLLIQVLNGIVDDRYGGGQD